MQPWRGLKLHPQHPWYWSWALPFVLFVWRPWLLVSGLALIYYLRFWFVYRFPNPAILSGLTGQRFFDEVLVWVVESAWLDKTYEQIKASYDPRYGGFGGAPKFPRPVASQRFYRAVLQP